MDKYLPIGSIVTINGVSKKIIIVGYYSIKYQNAVKLFDYFGYSYPEGSLLSNEGYSFNHSDIISIEFEGYKDEAYSILNDKMNNQQKKKDKLHNKEDFVNVQYDDNGVVVYKDLVDLKIDDEVYKNVDSIVFKNPFHNSNDSVNKDNDAKEPIFNNNELLQEDELKKVIDAIEFKNPFQNEVVKEKMEQKSDSLPEIEISELDNYFVVE